MSDIQNETLIELQGILDSLGEDSPEQQEVPARLRKLIHEDPAQIPGIYVALHPLLRQLPPSFIDLLGDLSQQALHRVQVDLSDDSLDFVEEALLRSTPNGKWNWLTVLALIQSPNSLDIFVRELMELEIVDQQQVLRAFAPLMQKPQFDPDWLYPALFQGLRQSILAPIIVDLANYCFRNQLSESHPAAHRQDELLTLLEQLSIRMLEIEQDPTSWSTQADQVSKMISDSVALIVSLCDTMALLQNQSAIPVIAKVGELRHRRVRAEAAFALAKLGNESGSEKLLELAQEPVSRLRVLHYAEELGLADRIDEKFKTPQSLAESELALWLSQPNQMGVPPSVIELVDMRNLYWPSYDDPIDCFLFRFEYRLGENSFSNLAIVGPMIHAFLSDLQSLDLEDVYAAFAGWQTEHDEIFELDLDSLSPHRKTDVFKLERRIHDFGAGEIETRILGVFFGEVFAIASCQIDEKSALAVADGNQVRPFVLADERPLDENIVRSIYVGRKLISAFNPE